MHQKAIRSIIAILILFLVIPTSSAQLKHAIRDEDGRHVIPRGFVINTEDSKGPIYYTPSDYHRMVKMGANFQVIGTILQPGICQEILPRE